MNLPEHRDKLRGMPQRRSFTTLIDAPTLAEWLQDPAADPAVVLDCRFDLANPAAGRAAYAAAHIPGARFADLNQDLSAPVTASSGRHPLPRSEALAAFLAAAGIADGTQVIAYDAANGSFAARAWWLLRWLGHERVAVLDGGFKAWTAAGGPMESGAAGPSPPAKFTPRLRPGGICSAAEVLDAAGDAARLLVDARAPERFLGHVEPLDAVAGHIPGAVNHPFARNLAADGCFLPAAHLRALWLERLGCVAPAGVILMCGSGVTACHNSLALEIAGLPGAVLYAGSWSEWIRDPMRPVSA